MPPLGAHPIDKVLSGDLWTVGVRRYGRL